MTVNKRMSPCQIDITYKVIRQNRKTVSLHIDKALQVIVKAPRSMSDYQVQAFVQKHTLWIQDTLDKKTRLKEQNDWFITKRILYLGDYKTIDIQIVPYAKELVILTEEGIKMITSGEEVKMRKAIELFFKERAKKLFSELTERYAESLGVNYNKITIRKQETRWGSCSQNGNLSYNVKLMCAPIEMIEYVILHEVMHLRHFNHSKEFWQDIERIMPDYKRRMHYFNQFGQNFII